MAQSTALHLIRDPQHPILKIYKHQVWDIWQQVDAQRRVIGKPTYKPISPKGAPPPIVKEVNLKTELLYLKEFKLPGIASPGIEFMPIHQKCGAPSRPVATTTTTQGPPPMTSNSSKSASSKRSSALGSSRKGSSSSARKSLSAKGSSGTRKKPHSRGKRKMVSRLSKRDSKSSRKSSRRASSKSKRASTQTPEESPDEASAADEDVAALLQMWLEADSDGAANSSKRLLPRVALPASERSVGDCPLKFAGGTFYEEKRVRNALKAVAAKTPMGGRSEIVGDDNKTAVHLTPHFNFPVFRRLAYSTSLAATAGAATLYFAEHAVLLAAGGAFAAVTALSVGASLRQFAKETRKSKVTASAKLLEKLWCLTYTPTCDGRPCFTRCTDSEGSSLMMPAGAMPQTDWSCEGAG